MATFNVDCPFTGCGFSTGSVPEAIAVVLLNTHAICHTSPSAAIAAARPRGPKFDRPRVDVGISMEQWNMLERRWNVFQSGSGIDGNSAAPQLFQCANETLGDALLKVDPDITNKSKEIVLATMKALAVIPVAIGVLRSELLEMKQKRDESFRAFTSRVRGKAETCDFVALNSCVCGVSNKVDYTDHIMRDVLVAGIYDAEIRRDILGVEGITEKPINEVISLVEKREMARDANVVTGNASAISSRQVCMPHGSRKFVAPPPGLKEPCPANRSKRIPCPQCGAQFAIFSEGLKGWNSKPHELCKDCYRSRRQQRRRGHNGSTAPAVSSINNSDPESLHVISQISVISLHAPSETSPVRSSSKPVRSSVSSYAGQSHPIKLNHHIFSSGEWRRARFMEHPSMQLTMSVRKKNYKAFLWKCPQVNKTAIQAKLDTCAQSCLWSLKECLDSGFRREDLIPVTFSFT